MKTNTLKPLAFATLCLASAFALAYTSAPCDPDTPPTCTGDGNGAQCGGEGSGGVIVISDPQPFSYYYCGGNTAGRCGGPNSPGTCSELLYRNGTAQHIQCMAGDTVLHDYGWCFTGDLSSPGSTGYDCGDNPCSDVPPGERQPPNIVGTVAPCGLQIGPNLITDCTPNSSP